MAIKDKIDRKDLKISKACDECRYLYQKLESVDRSGNRTSHSYNIIRQSLSKISDLVDDGFDVKIRKRIQRALKKAMTDVTNLGYDEL